MQEIRTLIEAGYEAHVVNGDQSELTPELIESVELTISLLDKGELRVCRRVNSKWMVEEWLKKSILLFFKVRKMELISSGPFHYLDKIPIKSWSGTENVRVVPQAIARYGSFIESGAVLMPSYINIGAYVGSGCLIDTWATIGSCAQIGKNVHVSGGVGIGGVLEPIQSHPVIVEDNAFIGSRCIIVEGAIVEEGAVLAAGVTITSSSKIIDVNSGESFQGLVPKNSVVIPGMMEREYPAGKFQVPASLIVGKRKESTDKKTSLTKTLREFNITG